VPEIKPWNPGLDAYRRQNVMTLSTNGPKNDCRHANNKINLNISGLKNAESRQVKMNFFHSIHLARMDFALTTDFKSKFWKCQRKSTFGTEHFDSKISKRLINGIKFIVNSHSQLSKQSLVQFKIVHATATSLVTVEHGVTGQIVMEIANKQE
jgi:hypothetical protein